MEEINSGDIIEFDQGKCIAVAFVMSAIVFEPTHVTAAYCIAKKLSNTEITKYFFIKNFPPLWHKLSENSIKNQLRLAILK